MSDFLPPRADRRKESDPSEAIEDPWVTNAFNDLARSETMFDNKRRFNFKIWHAVVFFVGLAVMPYILKLAMGG
jgi:hypothetical protein